MRPDLDEADRALAHPAMHRLGGHTLVRARRTSACATDRPADTRGAAESSRNPFCFIHAESPKRVFPPYEVGPILGEIVRNPDTVAIRQHSPASSPHSRPMATSVGPAWIVFVSSSPVGAPRRGRGGRTITRSPSSGSHVQMHATLLDGGKAAERCAAIEQASTRTAPRGPFTIRLHNQPRHLAIARPTSAGTRRSAQETKKIHARPPTRLDRPHQPPRLATELIRSAATAHTDHRAQQTTRTDSRHNTNGRTARSSLYPFLPQSQRQRPHAHAFPLGFRSHGVIEGRRDSIDLKPDAAFRFRSELAGVTSFCHARIMALSNCDPGAVCRCLNASVKLVWCLR
jgi:hypothetical protein